MLEYMQNGYGYGQQSYGMSEESHGYDEYHEQQHGPELVCHPVMDWSPKASKQQAMSHGSQTVYQEDDHDWNAEKKHRNHGQNGEKMYQNTAWNGPGAKYGHPMAPNMPPNGYMGGRMSNFQAPAGPYGGRYQGNMMVEAAEHEVYYKANAPAYVKSEGMRYYGGKYGRDGGLGRGYDDGYGCQSVEWEAKAL